MTDDYPHDDPRDGPQSPDEVWTYRGYRMSPGEFNNAMIHLYRGEVTRSNTWRTRLDSTTNWAVITTGAGLSFAFTDPDNPHFMLIFNTLLVMLFLFIEARRYRYYELWASRVRLMETDFFAGMLVPPFRPSEEWSGSLAASLIHPGFPITILEAFGRRFRRNYLWIFVILALAWVFKVSLHPTPTSDFQVLIERAAIGPLSGLVVFIVGVVFNVIVFAVGLLTIGLQRSQGEVHPEGGILTRTIMLMRGLGEMSAEIRPGDTLTNIVRPRDRLAYIITSQGDAVGQALMEHLKHGITALEGVGMYTGEKRDVLMTAIHPFEVYELKAIVHELDPHAFVVVNPTQDVMGHKFGEFRRQPRWLRRLMKLGRR